MTTWAIVPVKSLHRSKSRLAPFLPVADRMELMRCLLQRLLQVLGDVPQIDEVVVVSRDHEVAEIATRHLAHAVAEGVAVGLNGAVQLGQRFAAAQGANNVLILPTDLPFIRPEDVEALWRETAVSSQAIICSDRHRQGTNALLIPANVPFQFQYGLQSFQKHWQEAERMHLPIQEMVVPGLQFDLDTLHDWELFQARELTCGNY